jgi:flagellar hook-associated protein 2
VGSPITFSGFNSIDFNMILNAVMAQERTPITRLENQRNTLQTQHSAFGTLAGKLATLESAAESLRAKDSLAFLKATSSDAGVGVSTTSGTVAGTYDIVVNELAKAQVSTSQGPGFASTTSTFATGGTLTLTPDGGAGTPVNVTVTAGMTLEQLATAINNDEDSPASASMVQVSPGDYRLVLTGREPGTANAFTVGSTVAGLAYPVAHTQEAIDAEFSVNGLDVTSTTNVVSDVVAGATLTLTKKDPATTVTVTVSRDSDQAETLINKFISAYNDLQTFVKDQQTAALAGRASIGRDPLVRGLRDALRSAMMDDYAGGPMTRLAAIGLGFDQSGKMVLDQELFEEKVTASPGDVQMLVSGAAGDAGAFGAIVSKIEAFTQTGGLVASSRERIDEQVSAIGDRLDTMESQLAVRKAALQREYMAADLAMTRMKAQSASLSSVGGGYKLF